MFDGTFTIKSGTYDPDSVACRWDDYVDSFMEWVATEKPCVGTKYQLSKDSGLYSFMGLDYIIPYLKEFGLIKIWRQPIGKLWDEEYWWGIEVLPVLTMISALYEDPDIDDEIDRRVEEEEAFELDDRIRFAYEAYISRMMQEQKSEVPFWLFANKDEDHSRQTIDLEVSFRDIDCKRVIRMNLTDTLYDLHWMIQKSSKV